MAHYCICKVCNVKFDRDKEQAVIAGGRRYAHQTCMPNGELVPMPEKLIDKDLDALLKYAEKLLGKDYNPARVKKQIKDFKEEYGFSYSGMLKSLIYFYEVKGSSKEKANGGIGIVPFIYKDAYNYYLGLFQASQANQNKDVKQYISKIKEITIKPPSVAVKKHFFDFLEDDTDEK